MKTTKEYISLIESHAEELRSLFGIRSLRIFGSVSRNEQKEGSDVDVRVLPPHIVPRRGIDASHMMFRMIVGPALRNPKLRITRL